MYMNHVTYPLVLLTSAFSHRKLENFVILRNTDLLHFAIIHIISNFLKFLEFLGISLINLIIILMMPAKIATPGFL